MKGEDLIDAGRIAQQISLNFAREERLVAEATVELGPCAIGPAAVFRRAS
ncbi:hypothetical protein AB0N62_38655 [Streptomyces sp. NPDC093982]